MKIILFLSLITIFATASCQRDKLNTRNTTPVNVKRELSASPAEQDTLPATHGKTTSPEKDASSPGIAQTPPSVSLVKPKKEPVVEQQTVSSTAKRYHIIAASHPRKEMAEVTLARLKAKGYPDAQIIMKDDRYRVSIGNFPTQREASNKKNEFIVQLGQEDLWIMLY